jgi:hypothetical protein
MGNTDNLENLINGLEELKQFEYNSRNKTRPGKFN